MPRLAQAIALALITHSFAAAAAAAVDVAAAEHLRLGPAEVEYLLDPSGELDAAAALASDGWRPIDGPTPNFGFTSAAVWLRATVRNGGAAAGTWLLEVSYPNLDEVWLWTSAGGALAGPTATGDARPFADRPVRDRHFVFPLQLAPGEQRTVLARVRSTTSVQVPIEVSTPEAFHQRSQVAAVLHGVFFGMLAVMCIYNFVLFLWIREPSYLYYVGFVACFGLYQAFHHGFTYAYLWPGLPWWHSVSGGIAIHLTLAFGALFARAFLDLRARDPWLARALAALAGLSFANAAGALVVRYDVTAISASVVALGLCSAVFYAGVAQWRRGMTAARYFVMAWVAFLAGSMLFALSKLGVAPHNAVTENALQLGSVVEVVLLSFALGDRIGQERRARHRARIEALQRQQESAALARYVPAAVRERVVAGDRAALDRARRDVAVLCAVPFGFLESLTALRPDDAAEPVHQFIDAMDALARRHGGIVDRFVGPSIAVLFGGLGDRPLETSVRDAAAMAEELQREANALVTAWERAGREVLRLRMAVGIAAGPAVVGSFGVGERVEYAALGEPQVRARQLAGDAIPGEARLDEVAARHLRGAYPVTDGPPIEYTPGIESPTYRLADESEPGHDAPPVDTNADTLGAVAAGPGARTLVAGDTFDGRYRIERELGRGGTSLVYRATLVATGESRALKLINPAILRDGYAVEQFRREARETMRVHHPGIVRVHDFGRSVEGHYYVALDFVDGVSLADVLRRDGALPPPRAVAIALGILDALQAAHDRKLVHRDVKPGNVLLDRGDTVRVTDFGLVVPADGQRADTPIVGTPAYMSPEQSRGDALDARSDLYSFGVTFYEMLTGDLPDDAPGEAPAGVDDRVWRAIARCLAADPAERPDSARAVADELRRRHAAA